MNVDAVERKVEALEDRVDLLEAVLKEIIGSARSGSTIEDFRDIEQDAREGLRKSHEMGMRV